MERNSIYHGDCLDLMHDIEDGSVDMILADLPYGQTACHWDSIIPLEPLWAHYKRIIKPRGAIVLTASQPFTSMLVMSNLEWFKYEWVWDKRLAGNFLNANRTPLMVTESVVVFGSGQITYNPQKKDGKAYKKSFNNLRTMPGAYGDFKPVLSTSDGERYPTNIIEISNADRSAKRHETQKPVALFAYLIRTYTNPGDLVLDPTIGSGTTAIAAIETGRDWIGIERDEGYFEIAKARIEERLKQPFLPGIVDDVQPEKPEQPQLINIP